MKWIEIMDCYGEFLSCILCSWNADHSTHTHKPSINGENVNNMHQMILLMQKCYKSTTNNPYFCMRLNCKKWKKWKVPLWRLRTKRKPNVQFNSIQSQLKRTSKCFVINVECRFILLSFRILGFHSLFSPRWSLWFDEIIFRALAYEKTHSHTICTFPSDTHWLAGLIERTFFFHFFHWAWNAGFDGNHFQSSEIQTVFEFEFEERKKTPFIMFNSLGDIEKSQRVTLSTNESTGNHKRKFPNYVSICSVMCLNL